MIGDFIMMGVDQPKNRGSSFLGFIFVLLILILGVGLVSLFYFSQNESRVNNQEVRFWISSHSEQVIGQKSTFLVSIKNQEAYDLEDIEVALNFPEGFSLNSSFPACGQVLTQGCLWSFDKIKKGELKEIELKGQFFGQTNQTQIFDGDLNFRLAGFSSGFQKRLSSSVILLPSIFLTWQAPEQSSFGQKIESTLSLENISQEIIPQAEVIIVWPKDFIFKKASPIISEQEGFGEIEIEQSQRRFKWRIKDLNANDKKGLKFEGTLKSPAAEELIFNLQAGLINQDKFFIQIKEQKKILFSKFDFNIALKVNDLIEENQSCDWGQVLPVSLTFQNQSAQTIEDFSLKLKIISSQYIDFARLYQSHWHYYQDPNFQIFSALASGKISSAIISAPSAFFLGEQEKGWNQSLISVFKRILPETEGIIVFDLPIKTALEAVKANSSQAQITIQILAQGRLADETVGWEIQGNKINLPIRTDLKLNAVARYYDAERIPLGQGPLPPRLGKETRYWIFWWIKNTTNPLKDVLIKTGLPQGVEWTGKTKTSHGLILYSEANQEVNWQIPELSTYQGGPYSLVEAGFEVSLTPEISQLGQVLPLTKEIFLRAEDKFTSDLISIQVDYLDTNLKGDSLGQNQGRVIE